MRVQWLVGSAPADVRAPHAGPVEAAASGIDRHDGPAEVCHMAPWGPVETQAAEALRRLGDLPAAYTEPTHGIRPHPLPPILENP
jgi:hypothetical protein